MHIIRSLREKDLSCLGSKCFFEQDYSTARGKAQSLLLKGGGGPIAIGEIKGELDHIESACNSVRLGSLSAGKSLPVESGRTLLLHHQGY